MLQQTQVTTALPFYQRFIGKFPTLLSLARARETQVLALWSGLGYYRRARHLLAAARLVVREHGGSIPTEPERFARLPGVGRYTTGAVLSIAFGRPIPVVDGNVGRVLSRLYALDASVRDPRGAHALWKLAATLVPRRRPGDWNQALMELGALVCTPRAPRCTECPVRVHCRARALGQVDHFPPPVPRRETIKVRRAAVVIILDGRILMMRRQGALLDGLWEPPGVELIRSGSARGKLAAELDRLGLVATLSSTPHRIRHRITRHEIEVEIWRGELSRAFEEDGSEYPSFSLRAGAGREKASSNDLRMLRFVSGSSRGVAISALGREVMRRFLAAQ